MSVSVCRRGSAWANLALAVLVCSFVPTVFAASVVVGNCKALVSFSTIQAAITAIPANSTINICPGSYNEQLTINKSVNLTGVANGTSDQPLILVPTGGLLANATSLSSGNPLAPHIWVSGAAKVNISGITVDSIGNGVTGCEPQVVIGILYQNSSGTINHVVTRNQWIGTSENDTNSNGCQNGLGIFVQSGNSGSSIVTVENSSVHDYQKNGITGNEVGTTLTATGNIVMGQGATNGAAENGIQIGFGAAGSVTGNTVSDDVWAPDTVSDPGDAAAGILLYDATDGATVKNNAVTNTQFGIALVADTNGFGDNSTVTLNKVSGTRIFDGIDVCTNGNTIQSNTVTNSSESAIHLDASCGGGTGNNLASNIINDACVGVLVDGAISVPPNPGKFFAVGTTVGGSCGSNTVDAVKHAGAQRRAGAKTAYVPARP
ncbi:MAG TPA: right-handed parallel beta-helix repeat-containing protein [Candidatus Solibacter sp.]|nr:right-handed parallel beta-helix repeat-containing protein [Candidatus Solibacter sp.]